MKNRHSIALLVWAGSLILAPGANATAVVYVETVMGNFYVSLRDDVVQDTVNNFLRYVDADLYNNSFIDRSEMNFVIQGGSAKLDGNSASLIPSFGPINNQFLLSNVRGTIAMAKLPGDPNSATSAWFINLADNSANLDFQNSGFTVFGSVIDDGMTVVDAIARLPVWNLGSIGNVDLSNLPLIGFVHGTTATANNFVRLNIFRAVQGLSGSYTVLRGPEAVPNVSGPNTITVDRYSAAENPSPDNAPDVAFSEGFFDIALSNVTVGGTVTMILSMPQGRTPNTYYKYGPTPDNHTPHWYNFMWNGETGAIVGVTPNDVALVFVDGKRGDDDYTANGTIAGVGAPSVGAATSSGGGGALDIASLFAGLLIFFRRASACRRLY